MDRSAGAARADLRLVGAIITPTSFSTTVTWYIFTNLCDGTDVLYRPHGGRQMFRPVDRDVFVRDLNRQLGTPSHWLPVDSCKKEDKEAP